MTPTERAVMRALVERGHFPETPDGFRDAVTAALDITAAYRTAEPGCEEWEVGRAICGALYPDSTLMDGEFDRYEADQDAVWEAFRTAERNVA